MVISLDVALHRLLHKRGYRQAFFEDDHASLDLAEDDRRALQSIDRGELQRTAQRIARETLVAPQRGTGSLLDVFPRTIAAWEETFVDAPDEATSAAATRQRAHRALSFAFLDSEAFDTYRAFPYGGVGRSLEEAFFVFCEAQAIGDPVTRERELLSALVRSLAVTPTAEFTLPAAVQRVPKGFFAIGLRGAPMLFAATQGRYVTGEITPFLAELLLSAGEPDLVAARHRVEPAVLAQSLGTLRELGLPIGGAQSHSVRRFD